MCALNNHWEAWILIHKFFQNVSIEFNFLLPFLFSYIDDRLYIVMELIEGAPLGEHFSSLKEKRHHFAEERLWKIFIQVSFIFINFPYETVQVSADLPEVCAVVVSGGLIQSGTISVYPGHCLTSGEWGWERVGGRS